MCPVILGLIRRKKESMKNKADFKILFKLFFTMLYISTFTFGGGFVIITFMKKKFVDEYGWIDNDEMLDFTAIAQSSPGAIAVNAAILVGKKVAGALGTAFAVLGTVIPPIVILSVISVFYSAFSQNYYIALILRGMQAGAAAVVLDAACTLGGDVIKKRKTFYIVLMAVSFVLSYFLKINAVYLILGTVMLAVCVELIKGRKKKYDIS